MLVRRTINGVSRWAKWILGTGYIPKVEYACRRETLGSWYGRYTVAPDHLSSNSIVYSFGIGEDLTFEMDLVKKFNVDVYAFDPTPKSIQWVRAQDLPDKIIVNEYGIGKLDGFLLFYPPENQDFVSHTIINRGSKQAEAIKVPVKRLHTIMDEFSHDRIDLLKMDIEGSEYDVIDDLEKINVRPLQILVEFHHGIPEVGISRTVRAINQLRQMEYVLFAYSLKLEEFSFIHSSAVREP